MKFLKWLLIAVVVLIIGVPSLMAAGYYVRNKMAGPDGWAKDDALKALKAKMKDPDSTVIRSSYLVHKRKDSETMEIVVCGIVDGKNGFGAYTGGTRFVSVSADNEKLNTFDTYIVEMDEASMQDREASKKGISLTSFEEVYWNGYCVDAQHPALAAKS
ncbi:hypothetical protein CSQ93_20030 [Janthinobacterium sp. BJB426]|uniref:hypothetical protein n=1 Tax=Janthinobacterium sp. BJB426 TaxID=2048010 RepID=UPI000C121700|nr:hypothetical protein [Janthinobacterium sp. BJB426]PHV26377.1 hypothetical protein CSQ93_20030 [Janthinobacterium sp. BJB426]